MDAQSIIKSQTQTIDELQTLVTRLDSIWQLIGCLSNGKMVYQLDEYSTKKIGVSFLVEPSQAELIEISEW